MGEWPSIVLDIQSTLKDLDILHDRCTELDRSSQLLDPVLIKCAKAIEPKVEELVDAQRSQSYLKWLKAVQKWRYAETCVGGWCGDVTFTSSGSIDICLKRGSPQDAVRAYSKLSSIVGQLRNSKCAHLKRYATDIQQHWCARLQDRVTRYPGHSSVMHFSSCFCPHPALLTTPIPSLPLFPLSPSSLSPLFPPFPPTHPFHPFPPFPNTYDVT